jgi:hypothetical protein
MSQATHEQANLMLNLYDLRREPRLREAREWYIQNFYPSSLDDWMKKYPPTGRESSFVRMVISYWDMAAALCNRGLLEEDLFFETSGEQWVVWERLKVIVGEWRERFKNPMLFSNLEEHIRRLEDWRRRRAPGCSDAMRAVWEQMRTAQAAKSAGA